MYMKNSLGTCVNSLSLRAEKESGAAEGAVVLNVHGPCASHTVLEQGLCSVDVSAHSSAYKTECMQLI